MNWLSDPQLFMKIIAGLFAVSAIRLGFAGAWNQAGYSLCAALLNVFVINGGK
jgi:hypothetical protein